MTAFTYFSEKKNLVFSEVMSISNEVEENHLKRLAQSSTLTLNKRFDSKKRLSRAASSAEPLPIPLNSKECNLHDMFVLSTLLSGQNQPSLFENDGDTDESSPALRATTQNRPEEVFSSSVQSPQNANWLENMQSLTHDCSSDGLIENIASQRKNALSRQKKRYKNDKEIALDPKIVAALSGAQEVTTGKKSKNTFKSFLRYAKDTSDKPIFSSSINKNDVLFGRGERTRVHPGNVHFRDMISKAVAQYKTSTTKQKTALSNGIVVAIHSKGGRFLTPLNDTGLWVEVKGTRIRKKTSQALRDQITNCAK